MIFVAPKPSGRRSRKPGIDRKPRQAYSAKQLERLEAEFKVYISRFPRLFFFSFLLYVTISCYHSRKFPLYDEYFYLRRSINISAWASAWSCPSVWILPRCRSRRGSRIAARNGRSSWHRGWKSPNGRDFSHRRTFRQPSILYCRITRRLWCSEVRCRMTRTLACRLDPLYRPQIRSDAAQTRTTWSIVGRTIAKCNKTFRWPLRSIRVFLFSFFFFYVIIRRFLSNINLDTVERLFV